tara:strand:- start:3000 stop:3227 length:228 start_codon:yes stop_codon:yes gene_type:complete
MTEKNIYNVEDIFQSIPGDEKNVIMKIPDDIAELQGWKEGDVLKVEIGDRGTIIISKKEDDGKSLIMQKDNNGEV